MARLPIALAPLVLMACYDSYIYRPAEQATATMRGQPAARYQVPPESPKGDVRIASFGVAEVDLRTDGETQEVPMLHLRMVISNESDQPWQVDTRQLTVSFRQGAVHRPAYVNTEQAPGTPEMPIAAHGQRTLDLYYPLPPGSRGAKDIPDFDFVWQVNTAERRVAERTPFERLALDYVYPSYYASRGWYGPGWWGPGGWGGPLGWGPSWYYDPFYSGSILRARTPVIIPGHPTGPVYVPPPSGYRR